MVDLSHVHKETQMEMTRLSVLDRLALGQLTVDEAVTLLKVLSAIEALEIPEAVSPLDLMIQVSLN